MALGNEGDAFHQDNRPSGLIRTYLGRSPLVSGDESSLLLNATNTVARPVFTEYQASAFGNVKLVVHDCPVWVRGCNCFVQMLMELFFPPSPLFPFHEYGPSASPGWFLNISWHIFGPPFHWAGASLVREHSQKVKSPSGNVKCHTYRLWGLSLGRQLTVECPNPKGQGH